MSTLPPAAATAANAATNPTTQVSGTPVKMEPANNNTPPVNWDSEIQLVSSLAKLQELERQVSPGFTSYFQMNPVFVLDPENMLGRHSLSEDRN